MRAAAGFPVAAPDTLVGLPRQDVRLVGDGESQTVVVSYGQGLGAIVVAERKAPQEAASAGDLGSLPTVSLDGVSAHELATQLGTIVAWERNGVTTIAGSIPTAAGRGGRAGAAVSDEPPVVARGLVKRYGEVVAVDHVDLTVEPGDVFGYLGPNGAGKTTSLRMLLGLIRPSAGSARLFGRDPLLDGARALDGVAGFVEGPRFYPYLSGRKNLELLADYDGETRARASTRCSTSSSCATGPSTGSAATRTGCANGSGIAASLIRNPRLLLLDEPATGLDPAGMRDMRDLVRRLASEGHHSAALKPSPRRGRGAMQPRRDHPQRPDHLRRKPRRTARDRIRELPTPRARA